MGACGGKDERNGDTEYDDSKAIEESATTTPMIILEDVSSLDPIAATPPPPTKRKKRGKKYKKNLSRNQPEFGTSSPRSRNSSMSFEELPVEDTDNKTNSDTTVEDLDEESNNIEDNNKTTVEDINDNTKKMEGGSTEHNISTTIAADKLIEEKNDEVEVKA